MPSARLLLAGPAADPQIAALAALAAAHGLESRHVHADAGEPTRLAVGTHRLSVDGHELAGDAVLYHHRLRYDLPAAPAAVVADASWFQDHHIGTQQRASLLWSFLSAAEQELGPERLLNAWSASNRIVSAYDSLRRLQRASLPVPPLLLTSSLRVLRESATHGAADHVLWAFPDQGVPLRPLRRKRWPELFRGNDLPLLLLPPRTGAECRMWVLDGRPVLVARIEPVSYDSEMQHLETFTCLPVTPALERIAAAVHELSGLAFLELQLGASGDELRIEALVPDPDVMQLPHGVRAYLLHALFARLAARLGVAVAAPAPPPASETRDAVFLTRLLHAPCTLASP